MSAYSQDSVLTLSKLSIVYSTLLPARDILYGLLSARAHYLQKEETQHQCF